jgi:prevent-host-death family protein
MQKINIHEAKVHLSRYVDRVLDGETVILCRRNVPVAQLVPIAQPGSQPRPFGLAKGQFEVPDDFDEPLSKEELDAWYGD